MVQSFMHKGLRDAVLLEIAVSRPTSMSALAATPGLAERTAQRSATQILSILDEAAADRVTYEPPSRPDERQKAVLKTMQALVAATAERLGLAAETIAPKRDLSAALAGDRQLRLFRGWRREIVGKQLLDML